MRENSVLILDMDGTIADTYNYPDWVGIVRGHVPAPYTQCGEVDPQEVYHLFTHVAPMVDADVLEKFCNQWPETVIYSMTPWDATPEVEEATVKAKLEWLHLHYPFLLRNVVITKYKREKNHLQDNMVLYKRLCGELGQSWKPSTRDVLVDDDDKLRWHFIGRSMEPPWVQIWK